MAVPRSDKPKKESVDWTAEEEAELVAVLLQAREGGTQAESGWKATTWSLVVTALATKFSPAVAKTIGPCKMCWQRLKTHYKIVKTLREQSGFGWNEGKKLVTASKEVWDAYILAHPKAKPFRRRSFPLFAQMAHLVDGVIATGTGVFRSSSPFVGDIDEGDDDDEELADSGRDAPADEDGNKSSDDESDDKVTPSHKSKKRKAATVTKPARKRVRKSGTDAILSMSTAVTDMAAAMSNQGNISTDLCASTVRKTKAMQMVEDEEEGLTDLEAVTVAEIFMRNTAAADMYLAMRNKPRRRLWLEAQIHEEIGTRAALFGI